ncbi:hypothetical protein F5887DRAFT_918563 [Amanita rubescens]|nr:hypothetical protein F5887DRAFT_918563 [Amanita rubescens]
MAGKGFRNCGGAVGLRNMPHAYSWEEKKKIGASELQLASEGGGGAMLARGQASEQCGQHLVDCSMSDKGWRVWGNMRHGQHAAEGRIHEAELQNLRRSVGGSRGGGGGAESERLSKLGSKRGWHWRPASERTLEQCEEQMAADGGGWKADNYHALTMRLWSDIIRHIPAHPTYSDEFPRVGAERIEADRKRTESGLKEDRWRTSSESFGACCTL